MKKQTLFVFHWRQVLPVGTDKKGQVFAYSEHDARQQLTQRAIWPSRLIRRRLSSWQQRRHLAKPADITQLSRELATLLDAGIPIVQALHLIVENQNKAEMQLVVRHLRQRLEAGTSLTQALAQTSPLFGRFYCDLVATGEQTGQLAHAFTRLAFYREQQAQLRNKVMKAMIYPTMVVSVALGVSTYLLLFVIPKFKQIFASFDAQLPWLTRQVLALSHWVHSHALFIIAGLTVFALTHRWLAHRQPEYRYHYHRGLLKLPIIGDVLTKACIAKFARTLATTFGAGIPLISGLQSATKTMTNSYYAHQLNDASHLTATGIPLYQALKQAQCFPNLVTQMIMIGEESGTLDKMLNQVAQIYEQDVDNIVDNLGKIIEPILIVVMGTLVGGLVIAMYLPIFDLMSVLG
ncbi:type II secretion system protein F [Salinivibrio sp. IB868]|uniref:type II secretion system F family protein n=1 Tax=unclassified Salinivibrio TaxID=2636825 RepID=UPI000985276D|nr:MULTISPECIES: type II secretion system F family protein [unclassified Salinivibrio]OOE66878.1 type II secretion system protein F [Salinivibrio sp. IB868]OOE75750.1 type II secretion system protein F [Salinivibrio sp. IB870]